MLMVQARRMFLPMVHVSSTWIHFNNRTAPSLFDRCLSAKLFALKFPPAATTVNIHWV
jgi:hypothetical protein